jgi:hypothetical protein
VAEVTFRTGRLASPTKIPEYCDADENDGTKTTKILFFEKVKQKVVIYNVTAIFLPFLY